MRRLYILMLLGLLLGSCGVARKRTTYAESRTVHMPPPGAEPQAASDRPEPFSAVLTTAEAIVETALSFAGVRYRYGGTTRKGMDCSGLLYVSFQEHEVPLPRVSGEMAEEGKRIDRKEVRKGDLVFFNTRKRGRKINHVGLVVEVRGSDIRFIHSTTSRGVIVSSLNEGYWNYAFVKATRVF